MTTWPLGAGWAAATAQNPFGPSFVSFLLLCGVAALLLLAVVSGAVIASIIIGDAREARRRLQAVKHAGPPFARTMKAPASLKAAASTRPDAPAGKPELTVLYASETGNAEGLAAATGHAASRMGFVPHVLDMAKATPTEIAKAERLIVIASTWGEGEPPPRAAEFYDALMEPDAPRFEGVRFAVLALGDRAYSRLAHFCETGRTLDVRLAQLGGVPVTERSDCDADYEAQADAWIGATLRKFSTPEQRRTATPGGAPPSFVRVGIDGPAGTSVGTGNRLRPFDAEIIEKIALNPGDRGSETFHVTLSLAGSGILYEPGDSLVVLPRNEPAMIGQVLDAVGLGDNTDLRDTMATRYDVTTLTLPQLQSYAALTGDKTLADLAADEGRADAFLMGRQLIDMLTAIPCSLTAQQLVGLLRRLQPRLYSIASSRRATPDQAHLLIAAVSYETHGRHRKGVASTDVAERRRVGDRLPIYLKPNPHFRLPADPTRAIIMVGPGTGIAPFRAFMQEREATGSTGKNWLFFGHRRCADDFFYRLEWQEWLKRGLLSRLDLAWSRDQPEKLYVQNRMWEERTDLFAWLQDDATLYVCGNANTMARDVNSTLLRIAADQGGLDDPAALAWLNKLRRAGRYVLDVY